MLRAAITKILVALLVSASMTNVAHSDWRKDMGVFRIGVATQHGEPYRTERFEPLRLAIGQALQMPVEIFQARDASTLLDATASFRIEYAIVSSLGYATLEQMCACITPLVAPIAENGADAIRSRLIVNPSQITSLSELEGKSIAVGSVTSLTSNIIPMAQFSVNGKSLGQIGARLVQTESTEEALKLFLAGDVDAFFGWQAVQTSTDEDFENIIDEQLTRLPSSAVSTMWRSRPIRFGPHIVRSNLPREVVELIQQALIDLDASQPLAYDAAAPDLAGGLELVSKNDYGDAIELVRAIGAPDQE